MGLPGEDWNTIKETFELILEVVPDGFQASIAVPFPGTDFYGTVKKNGFLLAEDLEDLAFSHYAGDYPIIRTEKLSHEDLAKANKYANDVLPTLLKIRRAKRDYRYFLGLVSQAFLHPIKFMSHLRKIMSSSI